MSRFNAVRWGDIEHIRIPLSKVLVSIGERALGLHAVTVSEVNHKRKAHKCFVHPKGNSCSGRWLWYKDVA